MALLGNTRKTKWKPNKFTICYFFKSVINWKRFSSRKFYLDNVGANNAYTTEIKIEWNIMLLTLKTITILLVFLVTNQWSLVWLCGCSDERDVIRHVSWPMACVAGNSKHPWVENVLTLTIKYSIKLNTTRVVSNFIIKKRDPSWIGGTTCLM